MADENKALLFNSEKNNRKTITYSWLERIKIWHVVSILDKWI